MASSADDEVTNGCGDGVFVPASRSVHSSRSSILRAVNGVRSRYNVDIDVDFECAAADALDYTLRFSSSKPSDEVLRALAFALISPEILRVPSSIPRNVIGSTLERRLQDVATRFPSSSILLAQRNKDIQVKSLFDMEKVIEQVSRVVEQEASYETVRIPVDRSYHQWVRGPFSKTINGILERAGLPLEQSVIFNADSVDIRGPAEACAVARTAIDKVYESVKSLGEVRPILFELSAAQQAVLTENERNLAERVFEETGVLVEFPNHRASRSVYLKAPTNSMIGEAMTLIMRLCAEPVNEHFNVAPDHMAFVKARLADSRYRPDNVSFGWQGSTLEVSGTRKDVMGALDGVKAIVAELTTSMTHTSLPCEPKCVTAVLGRRNEHAERYFRSLGVLVEFEASERAIHIWGPARGVNRVRHDIEPRVAQCMREVEIRVPLSRTHHRLLIGPKGATVNALRQKHNVDVFVPAKMNEDVVVRGDKDNVEECVKEINALIESTTEVEETVDVPKASHRLIIGKNGTTINQIRRNLRVVIDVPAPDDKTTLVTIHGEPEDVEKAKEQIERLLASVSSESVAIPEEARRAFLLRSGKLRSDVFRRLLCSPTSSSSSVKLDSNDGGHTFTVSGPKKEVSEVVERFHHQIDDYIANNEQVEIEHHEAKRIKYFSRVIRQHGSANDDDGVYVTTSGSGSGSNEEGKVIVRGPKGSATDEAVARIKAQLDSLELEERKIAVNIEHPLAQKVFGRWRYLQALGGSDAVLIEPCFASADKLDAFELLGPADALNRLTEKLKQIECEWQNATQLLYALPSEQELKRIRKSPLLSQLEQKHNVYVEYGPGNAALTLIGSQDQVEHVRDALNDLKIIEDTIRVPYRTHSRIVGKRGLEINRIVERSGLVDIVLPPRGQLIEDVLLRGSREAIDKAKAMIEAIVEECIMHVDVPKEYHPMIIGRAGATVRALRSKFQVDIIVPVMHSRDTLVTVRGNEESKCQQAIDEIKAMINGDGDFGSNNGNGNGTATATTAPLIAKECVIQPKSIPILIGSRGSAISAFKRNFNVDVKFNMYEQHPDVVVITGNNEDCVDRAIEEMQKISDENYPASGQQQQPTTRRRPATIQRRQYQQPHNNSPPDYRDLNEFPTFRGN